MFIARSHEMQIIPKVPQFRLYFLYWQTGFLAHKIQAQVDIVSGVVEIIQIYEPRWKILLER